jgi:6-pyruvoyl-tetrahydropterin synthase
MLTGHRQRCGKNCSGAQTIKGDGDLERYSVVIDKQYLQFCSAHFILYKGGRESLHGHNFHCTVILEGDLTADLYVIDFADAKAAARQACDALDHRVLLPGSSSVVRVATQGEQVTVSQGQDLLFTLPGADVCILPLANVTTEQLAHYLSQEIARHLAPEALQSLRSIEVQVEETPGQRATYRRHLNAG